MSFKYSFMVPPLLGILTAITLIVTYIWSTANGHVKLLFPYISDTGTWPPESCFFSFLLYLISILMIFINYIRFRQVKLTYEDSETKDINPIVQKLNTIALWCGYIACFGLVIVASFQETNALWPHLFGANCAFGVGCLYQLLQTIISWKIYPIFSSKSVNILRIILTCISILTYCLVEAFGYLAMINFKGKNLTLWNKNDGGYSYHLISTVTEWILTISTISFFVIYTGDFRNVVISEPVVLRS